MDTPWKPLSNKNTDKIQEAIEYMHQAVQLVAAVGNSLLPKADDDSQTNLQWLPGLNALAGQLIDGRFRAALRYLPFELLVLDDENRIREGTYIPGQSLDELLVWLRKAVTRVGGSGKDIRPIDHYDIGDHPIRHAVAFPEFESAVHAELIAYRYNADWILNEVAGLYRSAAPVRTWPHHFDTGSKITIATDAEGNATQTIGIGWAVPDQIVSEPYYYVNHWVAGDAPDYNTLPSLEGGGEWYLDHWKGAILKNSTVISHLHAPDQQQEVLQFFRSAIRSTKAFLQAK